MGFKEERGRKQLAGNAGALQRRKLAGVCSLGDAGEEGDVTGAEGNPPHLWLGASRGAPANRDFRWLSVLEMRVPSSSSSSWVLGVRLLRQLEATGHLWALRNVNRSCAHPWAVT